MSGSSKTFITHVFHFVVDSVPSQKDTTYQGIFNWFKAWIDFWRMSLPHLMRSCTMKWCVRLWSFSEFVQVCAGHIRFSNQGLNLHIILSQTTLCLCWDRTAWLQHVSHKIISHIVWVIFTLAPLEPLIPETLIFGPMTSPWGGLIHCNMCCTK